MGDGVRARATAVYQNYATLLGIDKITRRRLRSGCPPRPETVIDGIMQLQDQIARAKHPLLATTF
jgi:NADH-quinone oxidoreductase subunit B